MMCDDCGIRPANIHLTTIVGGEKKEKNLCSECLLKNQTLKVDFSALASHLSGFLAAAKNQNSAGAQEPDIKCSQCGMSYETFKKVGQLGCANCYEDFRQPLTAMLSRIHGHTQHAGRTPGGENSVQATRMKLEGLKEELVKAIAQEEYENAASLRDQIRALKAQLEEENANG